MRISIPAVAVLIGVFLLPAHGQVTSVASGNWSNTATWGGTPPSAGDVTIAAGHVVTLDVDVPSLGAVGIDGTLVFGAAVAPAIRELGATDLRVRSGGRLEIGTAATPFPGRARITLSPWAGNPGLLGVEYGGAIEMVATLGSALSHTTLQSSLAVSATSATVVGNPGWAVGDRIAVASTDYDCRQAETFVIQSVTPLTGMTTYGLDHAASFLHFVGELAPTASTKSHHIAAEVARLDRPIEVRGHPVDRPAHVRIGLQGPPTSTPITGVAPSVRLEGVAFTGLGDSSVPGRYPLHFHYAGVSTGALVKSCCFSDNPWRAVVIHETMGVQVEDCVTYEAVDKAFYLENGSERDCSFKGNVAITTLFNPAIAKPGPIHAAAFYLRTQETELIANVAAGSEGTGYWLEGPFEPFMPHGIEIGGTPPPGALLTEAAPSSPTATRFVFDANTAHSCGHHGYFSDLVRPYIFAEAEGYQAYKCGVYGLFTRNFGYHKWNDVRISDCQVAIYAATTGFITVDGQGTTHFDDVLVVGDSVNVGSGWSAAETFVGRSLPDHGVRPNGSGGMDLGLFGLEIYDGVIFLENGEFANFQDVTLQSGATRFAAAITNRIENVAWAVDPRNTIRTTSFLAPCRPVYLRQGPAWANGVNQATIYDLDGSISSQSPSLQNAAPAWIVGGLNGTMLPDGTYAATNPPTTPADPAWISGWNAWVVPDNALSGTGAGGIAQLLIRDNLKQLGATNGYIDVQRNGSPANYHSFHTGGTGSLSNIFPSNLETNHVYDLSQPLALSTGLPVHAVAGTNVTYSLRFSRAGEWVTLRIPMTTGFDPFGAGRTDDITFRFASRLDMLLFPPVTWPAPGVPLTTYNGGADIPAADVIGVTTFPTNGASFYVPELTYPLSAPGTSSTFPFEIAWARDAASNTLEIRMVLLDYTNTAVFGPRPWFLPGGSLSFLPSGGYGTTLDSLFEGGMISVTVNQQ